MRDALVVGAVRSPLGRGKPGGSLSGLHPVDLQAHVLRELVDRTGVDPARVDDVIGGTVAQIGEQSLNTTRFAVLAAGFPESVPAVTVDRQCGSSQQALHFAAQGIVSGAYDVAIATGVESMSTVPIGSSSDGRDPFGAGVGDRYPAGLVPQGISAELIAQRWGLSRQRLDEYAARSHERAATAWADGRFDEEVAPVKVAAQDGTTVLVSGDESVRPDSSAEALAGLRPAFRDPAWEVRFPDLEWRVTAGNSSPVNDGAAALLVTTSEVARALGLRPRMRVHAQAVVGDDPLLMLTAIVPATRKVLDRAGLSLSDIDCFEVSEAFASVVLAWFAETGADPAKVNPRGGAIALGHPLGASGARLATTLLHTLEQTGGRWGLQVMCEAGGLANATVYERLDA